MTTYTDEVNVYNPDAIQQGIEEAGTTASNFITEVSSDNGIVVARAGEGTVNKQITSATTGWHLGSVLEYILKGVSRFWIGLKNPNSDTTPTVRIGKAFVNGASDNESHMELDYHSLKMVDKEGQPYFHVSDLRKRIVYMGEAIEAAEITETFVGTGSKKTFNTLLPMLSNEDGLINVWVNNVSLDEYGQRSNQEVYIPTAPANGSTVKISYWTSSWLAKAYTAGIRKGVITGETSDSAIGAFSFAEGYGNEAMGRFSHAEGFGTTASKDTSHSEGTSTVSDGVASHAEGCESEATASYAHAEGNSTEAKGVAAHSEGVSTTASGYASHAEGEGTTASQPSAHAEGDGTTASDSASHAEGASTTASEMYAHAEGVLTTASGEASHSEGRSTEATESGAHAEGRFAVAKGKWSHAQNDHTIAAKEAQTVLGTYNVEDASTTTTHPSGTVDYGKYAAIIGNGTSDSARSNSLAVTWDGDVELGNTGSRAISAPTDVVLHAARNSTTQYKMRVTTAGNIRMDKSTDSGATWATEYYFPHSTNGNMDLTDSGWINMTLASNAQIYGSGSVAKYRKIGNIVYLTGQVKPKAEVAAGGTLNITTLPAAYRPTSEHMTICQGSSQAAWALRVMTDGTVRAERYRNGGTTAAMTTSVWLPFSISYPVG